MLYDDRSGCGVNVEYVQHGRVPFVALSFVTQFGESGVHDLTLGQVDQLRAALDAVGRAARAVAVVQQQPAA
ncbi:hypothetical protein [Dactylosporangium vinaceum]|uniref:Uncharacterized protein n=1 Tax=Dactylosporangium vinaceum TaxID=53362 RepID=A0ABV5MQM4_9ACTN